MEPIKSFLRLVIIIVVVMVLAACDRNTIKGSGKVIAQAREVPSFKHIRAAGELKIVVIVGKSQQVVVKTNDNIQLYIVTSVKDDTLEILPKNGYQLIPTHPITVEISMKKMESLATAGAIQVNAVAIDSDSLDVHVSGSSQLFLEGEVVDKASINIVGQGRVDARRLIMETMDLYLEGSAWSAVHVNQKLDVRIAGNGEVVYFGNLAFLNQSIFGKGKVEKGTSEND